MLEFFAVVLLCCFSAVRGEVTATLEVSAPVGGEVTVRCSAGWSVENSTGLGSSMAYFCKGACSRENTLIQAMRTEPAVTWRGRYSMQGGDEDGAFSVTIKRLRRADQGRYHCRAEIGSEVFNQEINLRILDAPSSRPCHMTTPQTKMEAVIPGDSAASPQPSAEGKKKKTANTLSDTTMVIIISVSLALLVCAIIPLIFYSHWRSNTEEMNCTDSIKGEAEYCDENSAVMLQSVKSDGDAEPSCQDASQYAAIYQALDPKSLD